MSTLSSDGKMASVSSAMKRPSFLLLSNPSLKRKIEYPIVPPKNDNLRFRDLPHRLCFEGNGFGVVSRIGKKTFMDDSHIVKPCFGGSSNKSFFGVYDGHGDGRAAKYVAANLHKNVLEMIKNCEGKEEKEEALKAAYLKTDRDFLEKDFKTGACCVTVLIQDKEMIVSNLGDCRVVLCRGGGVAEALTSDHKPERDDERKRIENQGGYVGFHGRAWRVAGKLAVSRSIGDKDLKKWVIGEPETRILELEEDMEFLVLASDGLWDVVSNQEAVDTVSNVLAQEKTPEETSYERLIQGFNDLMSPFPKRRRLSLVKEEKELLPVESPKPENETPGREIWTPTSKSGKIKAACKRLVDMAVSRGSRDDITVVIVDLNQYKF